MDLGSLLPGSYESPEAAGGITPDAVCEESGLTVTGAQCRCVGVTPLDSMCLDNGYFVGDTRCFPSGVLPIA